MRCVTVQHFGNDDAYTFITKSNIRPGELLYVDTKEGIQVVHAITSDFEVFDTDVYTLFGVRPYKEVFAKYCELCAYRVFNTFDAADVTYPVGWVPVKEGLPSDTREVVVHTASNTFLARLVDDVWTESYTGDVILGVKEWFNVNVDI